MDVYGFRRTSDSSLEMFLIGHLESVLSSGLAQLRYLSTNDMSGLGSLPKTYLSLLGSLSLRSWGAIVAARAYVGASRPAWRCIEVAAHHLDQIGCQEVSCVDTGCTCRSPSAHRSQRPSAYSGGIGWSSGSVPCLTNSRTSYLLRRARPIAPPTRAPMKPPPK
jgi:hypothetical protein